MTVPNPNTEQILNDNDFHVKSMKNMICDPLRRLPKPSSGGASEACTTSSSLNPSAVREHERGKRGGFLNLLDQVIRSGERQVCGSHFEAAEIVAIHTTDYQSARKKI